MPDCGCNHFPASGGNVTFDPGVQVGIGTTGPTNQLHLVTTTAGAFDQLKLDAGAAGGGNNADSASLQLEVLDATARGWRLAVAGAANSDGAAAGSFYLKDVAVGAIRLTIDTGGVFRIGTTPQAGLEYSFGSGDLYLGGGNGQAGDFYIKDQNGVIQAAVRSDGPSYVLAGNVGVGDANPPQLLSVAGTTAQHLFNVGRTGGAGDLVHCQVNGLDVAIIDQGGSLTIKSTVTNPVAGGLSSIKLGTNAYGDAIVNLGTAQTGALLVYQGGAQVLGVGRAQFGVYTVDGNGVDYPYLALDPNGLHLAATNPGFHGSMISLGTNTFGDAILSVGTGPGVGDLIVMQSGSQLMSVDGGGNLALAGRTVANGNGCLYA